MNTLRLLTVSLLSSALLACGGGSSGEPTNNSSSSQAGQSSSQSSLPDNTAIRFGNFLDAAVANIGYRTDSLSGVTDASGGFQYLDGETLEFFIGDLVFPPVRASGTVTPLVLAGSSELNEAQVINLARLLQSLDADGNLSNGIQIPEQASSAASAINFDQSVAAFEADSAVINFIANAGGQRTTLVSESSALAHLQQVLNQQVNSRVVVSADGPGNTYELFNEMLGGTAVESPVCDYSQDSFGRRITEVFDTALDTHVFAFHMLRDVDGDRCISTITDRQRIEIKTYGPSPAHLKGTRGEVHTYRWKFKLDEGFQPSSNFTHIFQIKASGGNDDGPPIITLTPRTGNPNRMEVVHTASAGFGAGPHVRATANLSDFEGEWVEAYVRTYYEEQGWIEVILKRISDGKVLLSWSHNDQDMWRAGAGFNRPKWGIYRSLNQINMLRDETVWFNDFCIAEGTNTCPSIFDGGGDSQPGDTSSSSSSSSSSGASSSAAADFDFEADTLGGEPAGFTISGPAVVTDEHARTGSQSVKLSRTAPSPNQNTSLRQVLAPADTGSFKASLYLPGALATENTVQTFMTVFGGGYNGTTQRAIDIVFHQSGEVRRREGASQTAVTDYQHDAWLDVVIAWENISTTNTFQLTLNGVEVGSFNTSVSGVIPDRIEIKFGQNDSAVSENSIFLDEVSVW